MLTGTQNYGSTLPVTTDNYDVEMAKDSSINSPLESISAAESPEPLMLNPMATAELTDAAPLLKNRNIGAAACCIPPSMAGIYAASGAITGSVGAAVLNKFGVERFGDMVAQAAKQGAVGGAVLGGSIGLMVSCCCAVGAALADGDDKSSAGGGSLASGLLMSIASNALGNAILTSAGDDTTSQIDGLAAAGTGTATMILASMALGCVLCACATGIGLGVALSPR